MAKYEVLGKIGEGSFGQVFKVKNQKNGKIFAQKVISKLGRSPKELDSLRQECEIQCRLNHSNIIQMIESFESKDKIIIITEYAEKELYELLSKVKDGRLSEKITQVIAHDLVSALGYLHSNLVLHRDLKPQNVLLESSGIVKLCDFGFARSMSSEPHMLMSIKGTPLYMAPELIKGHPYDYNADLWSLGCIIYELIVGHPPFKTTCILNLDHLIKCENIKWPENASDICVNFLQGLLEKDPAIRLTWPDLSSHPFLDTNSIRNDSNKNCTVQTKSSDTETQRMLDNLIHRAQNMPRIMQTPTQRSIEQESNPDQNLSFDYEKEFIQQKPKLELLQGEQPIENEEWIAFLQRSMEEVMEGELSSLLQQNCISVFLYPLRNPAAGCKLLEHVAKLLSLVFVVPVGSENLDRVLKVYLEVKVVLHLVYAIRTLMTGKDESGLAKTSSLLAEELEALESVVVLLCRLVHTRDRFVTQLYDAVHTVKAVEVFRQLLDLEKRKPRIVADFLAVLTHVLRSQPENADLVEKVALMAESQDKVVDQLVKLLGHSQVNVKCRICKLMRLMGRFSSEMLKQVWCKQLQNSFEELLDDKNDGVRIAAEETVMELKHFPFYHQ